MSDKLSPITEGLLEGIYKVKVKREAIYHITHPIESSLLIDNKSTRLFLDEIVYCGLDILTIAIVMEPGYDVVLTNPSQIINIYNRVEHYLREAEKTYSEEYSSKEFSLKLTRLNSLAETIFDKHKALVVKDSTRSTLGDEQGYYSFGGGSTIKGEAQDFSPEEFKRSSKLELYS